MAAKCPPFTGWPTGDLNKESRRASDCWTLQLGGKGLITILYSVPLITSVFSSHLTQCFSREGHPPVSVRHTALTASHIIIAATGFAI